MGGRTRGKPGRELHASPVARRWINLKIRTQIAILIGFSVIAFLLLGTLLVSRLTRIANEQARISVENLMRQVGDRVRTTAADMSNLARVVGYHPQVQEYLAATDPLARFESYRNVRANLLSYQSSIRDVYAILLLDNQGRLTDTAQVGSGPLFGGFVRSVEARYDIQGEAFRTPLYSSVLTDADGQEDYFAYLAPIFSTVQQADYLDRLGTILVFCSTTQFQKTIRSIETGPASFFLILDSEDHVVGYNNPEVLDPFLPSGDAASPTGLREALAARFSGSSRYIVSQETVASLGWTILSVVDTRDILRGMTPAFTIVSILAAFSVLLLLLAGSLLLSSISVPMRRIVAFLDAYPRQNYRERMKPGPNNEMGIIVQHFNQMMDKMDEIGRSMLATQARLYDAELEGNRARFSALQSQVNPHFLYNTLDCIRGQALVAGVHPIAEIVVAMSAIFRYSVQADKDATLREEMDIVSHYVRILRIRHQDRIGFVTGFPDEILKVRIPRMILQPVVENAVYHGLEPKEGPGTVRISGHREDDRVVLVVEDDGVGMDARTEAEVRRLLEEGGEAPESEGIRKTSGIGLVNIHRRLRLLYGERSGLSLGLATRGGLVVTITIPIPSADTE